MSSKENTEVKLIYDLIWLDALGLCFVFYFLSIFVSKLGYKIKSYALVSGFCLFGLVSTFIFLSGTPFGINGYWGDQGFRQTMILKFMEFSPFTDFYYKGVPPFYPPFYFLILALIGKLFSFQAFQMIKIGSLLIYSVCPFLLFIFWRKIVTSLQAALIVLLTYLICSIGQPIPHLGPHTFLACSFFIPWWLYYVEQAKQVNADWKFYLSGGIIGGLLFMTYYYPFLIVGILLLARTLFKFDSNFQKNRLHYSLKKSWAIIASSAIFSAPFWGPLLTSIIFYGSDSGQQKWHHIDSVGYSFLYGDYYLVSIAFAIGIVYCVRNFQKPLYRRITLILISTAVFYFIGSIAGALDYPLLIIKAKTFLVIVGGAIIGLALGGFVRFFSVKRKFKFAFMAILCIILVFLINDYNKLAKHPAIKSAKRTKVPNYLASVKNKIELNSSVLWSCNDGIYAYLPVYSFLATGQHSSNPLGQFSRRYDFLRVLGDLNDSFLINVAFRHNIFDPIEYFHPYFKEDSLVQYVSLSSYPNKFKTVSIKFSPDLFADTLLFERIGHGHFYRPLVPSIHQARSSASRVLTDLSLGEIARILLLTEYLDREGQSIIKDYLYLAWEDWKSFLKIDNPTKLNKKVSLISGYVHEDKDSTDFVLFFKINRDIAKDYEVHLRLSSSNQPSESGVVVFTPEKPSRKWEQGNIIYCHGTIQNTFEANDYQLELICQGNTIRKKIQLAL